MSEASPWIQWVTDEAATGEVAEIYDRWKAANPERDRFPEILKCFSHSSEILQGVMDFCYPLQFSDGALTRELKELIATFVSAINRCKY